jgi:hypothetical protein
MTREEIIKFSNMDEKKALLFAIVFFLLGLFIVLAIVFWPLSGYQIWKYCKIKEAKNILNKEQVQREPDIISTNKRCSKCNADNPENSQFCKECGNQL